MVGEECIGQGDKGMTHVPVDEAGLHEISSFYST